jgi:hypothetical protein
MQVRKKQTSGSDARSLIAPVNGFRGAQAARGKAVKNHAKENRVALKEMAARRNEAEIRMEAEKTKGMSKMKQFQGVKSRAFESNNNNNNNRNNSGGYYQGSGAGSPPSARGDTSYDESNGENNYSSVSNDSSYQQGGGGEQYQQQQQQQQPRHSFLRKNTGLATGPKSPLAEKISPREQRDVIKSPTPLKFETLSLKPRENKNFRERNKAEMMEAKATHRGGDARGIERHDYYGQVPSYLQERKMKWADEERLRELNREDADCPAGMVCMPEAERLDTLEILRNSEIEAQRELFALPLAASTIALTRKKNALEAKLREIEDAKAIFSRPKVYISQ